ncbi:MAG TPA: NAD(P)/FAD-dependent oxidoreductase [Mycobacterium sp.]
MDESTTRTRAKVVVVGGGFGGVNVSRVLAKSDVDLTIIDRTNHHLFQPLLYQVATGILPEGLIAPALRRVVQKQKNTKVVLGQVVDLDLQARTVATIAPDGARITLPYDTLVVAAGATHAYFGHDEWEEFAPGMKTLEDARHLRNHILGAFEMAELATDPAERDACLSFVVVGAGPTGVEVVGQIAELAHRVLPGDYREIDTRQARIVLIEAAPAVLGPFDERLQRYTTRTLERMGVEVRCATAATAIDADGITVRNQDGEERIEARTKVWAAGVQASPLAKMLAEATGAETDRAGRIMVEPDCTLPGHPEVFAIGDMVSLNGLPGIAQPALQEGKYVGKVIRARLDGDTSVAPFKYFDKGTMATIGRTHAVARSGGMSFTGITAYLMWAFIHVLYLIGWGNRFGTLYSWGRSLWFTKNRAHRIITLDQAIDEIGDHGSAPADATRSDIGSSDNGARQPSTKL